MGTHRDCAGEIAVCLLVVSFPDQEAHTRKWSGNETKILDSTGGLRNCAIWKIYCILHK